MRKQSTVIIISSLVKVITRLFFKSYHKLTKATEKQLKVSDPTDIPLSGWKMALKETRLALKNKELGTLSAALAYYGTFAFFPSLVAFISIYSLVISSEQLVATTAIIDQYLPRDIASLITSQLTKLIERPQANIIAAVVSIALALFAASGGVQNLIKATNKAYDVEETRSFVKLRIVSLCFTLAAVVLTIPIFGLLVLRSDFLVNFGVPDQLTILLSAIRWLLIITIISIVLAAVYRYGPNRQNARWQWVSWGAVAATILWAAGSAVFFYYLQNFANYQESYGIFAGIIALMLWFNLSALVILLGAEVNHRLELQTTPTIK